MEGEGGLEPLGSVVYFEGGDPLYPLVAATAGGDEAEGKAVAVGEGFVADDGGQQKLLGFVNGESAGVAGDGADGDAGGFGVESGAVEDFSQGDASPVLGGVPPAGAVEGGGHAGVVGNDFVVSEGEFALDVSGYS